VRRASAIGSVGLPPAEALELWASVERWPSFVEGFARHVRLAPEWPEQGARVVWESTPEGRGRVTEMVTENTTERFSTQIFEEALSGVQTFQAVPAESGSQVALALEYELTKWGPLRGAADALFIRRALRDSLKRTLFRFALEADEEARLR
jgi:hypothetical protein